ncbi:MAG: hypothetical protein WCD43_16865 [Candidatus Acidiferrales bacterium]
MKAKKAKKSKEDGPIKVVDTRRMLALAGLGSQRATPPGRRDHAVLLGHYDRNGARKFLEGKGLEERFVEELLQKRVEAEDRIKSLPPLDNKISAPLPITDREAIAEIEKVMEQPDCEEMYPPGTWTARLIEISKLIPFQPNLDVAYAESLGPSDLSPSHLLVAVKLCFSDSRSTAFGINVDESQKSVTITGINPTLQVRGVQFGKQQQDGPFVVTLLIGAAPNIVQVSQFGGRSYLASGYHRVYRLMKAGFSHVPCIVHQAKSIEETGARGPGFFAESVLTAPRPPLFPDFADKVLGVIVPLRAVSKVIRIRPDEYFVFR